MGITRVFPKTSAGRARFLKAAKTKNDSLAPAAKFLTPATEGRLNVAQPTQKALRDNTAQANSNQVASTVLVEAAKEVGIRHASHFIQVFHLGVLRKKYARTEFPYFHLPENYSRQPEMRTELKLLEWVENIVTGDAQRMAAGGVAMSNPSAAEVGIAGADFEAKNIAQSALKDIYDQTLEAEQADIIETDGTIRKIGDEVHTRYNEEDLSSMRRKAREWGIPYESDITNTFNIHVQDIAAGHAALSDATVEVVESGNTKTTNATGDCIIKSRITDEITFEIQLAGYVTQQKTVTLVDGQLVYPVLVDMVHV